jgi:hypothetical protein
LLGRVADLSRFRAAALILRFFLTAGASRAAASLEMIAARNTAAWAGH